MNKDIELLELLLEDARRETEEAIRLQQELAERDRLFEFLAKKNEEELVSI